MARRAKGSNAIAAKKTHAKGALFCWSTRTPVTQPGSNNKITVRNILRRHHLEPAPQRRKGGMSWSQFLKLHWDVLAATDFFTVEVATWHGLVTYYVLVVMELATRRVHIAGITPHPTAAFMQQCARQLTDPYDGFLSGKRYLIHDRDAKFTQAFDTLLKASSVEPIVLPPRSPNLNAHCERFVRSIKEEALEQMIMLGERVLYYVLQQYLAHYHTERNHQGLDNQLIMPERAVGNHTGHMRTARTLRGLAQLLSSRGRVMRRSIATIHLGVHRDDDAHHQSRPWSGD